MISYCILLWIVCEFVRCDPVSLVFFPDIYCLSVHILSGDLIIHKRTLEPIRTMVYGLRRYDLERCRAVADSMALERQRYSDTDSIKSEPRSLLPTRKLKMDPVLVSRAKRRRQRKRKMVRSSKIQAPHLIDEDDHGYVEIEGYQLHSGESKVEGFFSCKSKVYLVGKIFDFVILTAYLLEN